MHASAQPDIARWWRKWRRDGLCAAAIGLILIIVGGIALAWSETRTRVEPCKCLLIDRNQDGYPDDAVWTNVVRHYTIQPYTLIGTQLAWVGLFTTACGFSYYSLYAWKLRGNRLGLAK